MGVCGGAQSMPSVGHYTWGCPCAGPQLWRLRPCSGDRASCEHLVLTSRAGQGERSPAWPPPSAGSCHKPSPPEVMVAVLGLLSLSMPRTVTDPT